MTELDNILLIIDGVIVEQKNQLKVMRELKRYVYYKNYYKKKRQKPDKNVIFNKKPVIIDFD